MGVLYSIFGKALETMRHDAMSACVYKAIKKETWKAIEINQTKSWRLKTLLGMSIQYFWVKQYYICIDMWLLAMTTLAFWGLTVFLPSIQNELVWHGTPANTLRQDTLPGTYSQTYVTEAPWKNLTRLTGDNLLWWYIKRDMLAAVWWEPETAERGKSSSDSTALQYMLNAR